jgi:hypothetical protein
VDVGVEWQIACLAIGHGSTAAARPSALPARVGSPAWGRSPARGRSLARGRSPA